MLLVQLRKVVLCLFNVFIQTYREVKVRMREVYLRLSDT